MSAPYDRRAFTLFEMLAAVAVAMIIAVFVFAFSNSLIQIMRANDSKIGTEVDANVALDIIARDLEAAVFREGRGVMFAVDAQSTSSVGSWANPKHDIGPRPDSMDLKPSHHYYGWAGCHLRFIAAYPAFNAISYQIVRRNGFTSSKKPRYTLFRSVVAKHYTEEAGVNIDANIYKTGTVYQNHPSEVKAPYLQSFFLDNVVDFGVRLYVYETDRPATDDAPEGLRLIFPAIESGALSENDRSHFATTGRGNGAWDTRNPDVVEVYLRVLDRAGAELLMAMEEDGVLPEIVLNEEEARNAIGTPPGPFEKIILRHGRLYSRTVTIPSKTF